jgi:uncharacterized protein (UPF0335 family)
MFEKDQNYLMANAGQKGYDVKKGRVRRIIMFKKKNRPEGHYTQKGSFKNDRSKWPL